MYNTGSVDYMRALHILCVELKKKKKIIIHIITKRTKQANRL